MLFRKKRWIIPVVWLIVLAVTAFVLYRVESNICFEQARQNLTDLSVTASARIPAIAENDYLTRVEMNRIQLSRSKALAFALEGKEDISQAKEMLDDYFYSTKLAGLSVYSRSGELLYQAGEADNMDSEAIRTILEKHLFRNLTEQLARPDLFSFTLFTTGAEEIPTDRYMWSTSDDRLLVSIKAPQSKEELKFTDYFSWKTELQKAKIGKEGFVLALENNTGTVLTHRDSTLSGQPYDSLSVELPDGKRSLSFSELQETLRHPGQVTSIRISGAAYLASRANTDKAMILLLQPEAEIQGNANGITGAVMVLLGLVTGICVLYVLFSLAAPRKQLMEEVENPKLKNALSAKTRVMGVIAILLILIPGIYLQQLFSYAETFRYTRTAVDNATDLMGNTEENITILTNWFQKNLQLNCNAAETILMHLDPQQRTPQYLSDLSKSLGTTDITLFDNNGRVVTSSSPYLRGTLPSDNPFRVLLDGTSSYTAPLETDPASGVVRQQAGISLLDREGFPSGMMILSADTSNLQPLLKNLGAKYIFERVGLTDDTVIMVIRDSDMTISYVAEVANGTQYTGLNAYDYSGHSISELGISDQFLRDHYNGNLFLLDNQYFASVRRIGDFYYMIMKPQIRLNQKFLFPQAAAGVSSLVFVILMILCVRFIIREQMNDAEDSEADSEETESIQDQDEEEFLAHIFYKKKPYFEDRWPEDCLRWKDRSTESKFHVSLRIILVVSLIAILIHAFAAGENSIWYYCISGEWSSGINLYSVTTSIIAVSLLLLAKMLIHKLLFMIARSVEAKGETICFLLDSFSGYILTIIGVFVCLSNFGVNTATLSLTGGVAGVIFGIGCQNTVADMLAGILMSFDGITHVGDFVSYNGKYGYVMSVGVRTTKLKWFHEITMVRNNEFKNFIFMSSNEKSRAMCNVTIDMTESLERVEGIIKEELPLIHEKLSAALDYEITGPVYRGVTSIASNGFVLSFILMGPGQNYMKLCMTLNREIKLMCERRNIKIALPQIVVHSPAETPEQVNSLPASGSQPSRRK